MRKVLWQVSLLFIASAILPYSAAAQTEQTKYVQAVLFYSPTCPHCHTVINETLIPLVETYGEQLEIVALDVTHPGGQQLYQSAIVYFEVPEDRLGVPLLVVGEMYLFGSVEIPAQFPAIVEEGLSGTGISWPQIPGLADLFAADQLEDNGPADPAPTVVVSTSPNSEPTAQVEPTAGIETTRPATAIPKPSATAEPAIVAQATTVPVPTAVADFGPNVLDANSNLGLEGGSELLAADPVGKTIASLILMAMVIACAYVAWRIYAANEGGQGFDELGLAHVQNWAIPILTLAGFGVASYLAYVEFTHVEAFCGPVGHCNIVQSSAYAHLLGVPVALLGLITYVAIMLLWLAQRYLGDRLANWPTIGLMALTILGVLFSIYLTLLELFVIHAVCAWCLASAVIMLLLMLLVAVPATTIPDRSVSQIS